MHDLRRLLRAIAMQREMKAMREKSEKSNFSRDGCFGMFMMIINIIIRPSLSLGLLSWIAHVCATAAAAAAIETDIYDVCVALSLLRKRRSLEHSAEGLSKITNCASFIADSRMAIM